MRILVVDDEESQRDLLAGFLKKRGYEVKQAASGKEAIEISRVQGFDLAIMDLKMAEIDGIEAMTRIKEIDPETCFLILTGYGTVESAVEVMKLGAYDYLSKPVNLDELELIIERISEEQFVHRELEILREEKASFTDESVIAESKKMKDLLALVARIAKSNSTVLINGESGTGKEVIARLIHKASDRRNNRFVAISCAALPETLLESELFGFERGAFTGADKRKVGKLELAHNGTLLLDEIGDIPTGTQVKLLRVLQEFTFERLGGTVPIKVDVRLIAATNQDLRKKIAETQFREDLYYRLNVISIDLPSLRERKEDIKPLVDFFIKKFSMRSNKIIKGITREAVNTLMRYEWPGNIRELENVLERAVVLCRGEVIDVRDVPIRTDSGFAGVESLAEVEKRHIRTILEQTSWNISEAARKLGVHRNTLRLKIKEYGLTDSTTR
ncbi:hypothetical protein A2Y85_02265 [candidate division WOR-3 bacterium RBG_13_43_14]|uniref:Two-component system response regulator n=1 Tax=candidate division WOR-3 bacterium RBG_13_43_14 TaxID=1802590 RepID=A0A1F4U9L1_UNCW3|nr:MAG: hypothetical protein A2Y85_02265 [candidate division WOR-3 bacterium RBG_13_43_14]